MLEAVTLSTVHLDSWIEHVQMPRAGAIAGPWRPGPCPGPSSRASAQPLCCPVANIVSWLESRQRLGIIAVVDSAATFLFLLINKYLGN